MVYKIVYLDTQPNVVIVDDGQRNTSKTSVTKMRTAEVIDSLSVSKITSYWASGVAAFGIAYYALSYAGSAIINGQPLTTNLIGFGNSVYFSFITALTIGYNNFVPTGIAKPLVIIEALGSMVLFGMLITKLVATKQEQLSEQIKELSYEEATNRAISELYLFRSQAREITEDPKKSFKEYEPSLLNFRDAIKTFNNAKPIIKEKEKALMHLSLMTNSINFSCSRLVELLEAFSSKKIAWKKESTTATIAELGKIKKTLDEQFTALRSDDQTSKYVEEKLEDLDKTLATLQKFTPKQ